MNAFVDDVREMLRRGELFLPPAPIHVARAPGRLDLMGGNDDYTGGMVFEATIREATWAAAQRRGDDAIVLVNPQMREQGWLERVEFDLADLTDPEHVRRLVNREATVRWTAYVLGLFYWLKLHFAEKVQGGMSVLVRSEVPLNKGVSSSAAIEVAVMKAAARAYGIDLAGVELAEACQWVENVIAQSACGIMDQIAVVLGDEGAVLPLVCQPCLPRPLVRLPAGLTCWGLDSGVRHQVSGIEYEAARAAGFMGYKLICDRLGIPVRFDGEATIPRWTDPRWNGYLANLPPSLFRELEPDLPVELSGSQYLAAAHEHVDPFTNVHPEHRYRVRACTRYAVEENHRVQLYVELARGMSAAHTVDGAMLMGELMHQSHLAYTESGLGCAQTDMLVDLAREQGPRKGIFGAKITGGGGGGTVAILGREDAEEALLQIVEQYRDRTGIEAYVFRGSSIGADRFGVVTIEPLEV
jgi:galactokinase